MGAWRPLVLIPGRPGYPSRPVIGHRLLSVLLQVRARQVRTRTGAGRGPACPSVTPHRSRCMTSSPKLALLAAGSMALAALAGPAAAGAAQGFAAITRGDQLVTLHSDTIPALSDPQPIADLPGRERLVALDARPGGGLLALGAGGTLYDLDGVHHRVTRTIAALGTPVAAGAPVTLSAAADGATARVIAGGRDKTVDLATGAVISDTAATAAVSVDLAPDGVYRGVDPAANAIVTLDGAGAHVVAPLHLTTHAPTSATTGADGSTWVLTALPHTREPDQSRLLRYDPAAGLLHQQSSFLFTQLDALAATGAVPDDTTAPRARVRIPRQSVAAALKRRGFIADVTTSEPGQTVMSARVGGSYRGFGFSTAIRRGTVRVLASSNAKRIKASAGHRIRLHIAVHDWAGNTKLFDRYFTLGR